MLAKRTPANAFVRPYPKHCGSEPARDGGVSGNTLANGLPSSRASPAPTGMRAAAQIHSLPQNLWERACSRWLCVRRLGFCWCTYPFFGEGGYWFRPYGGSLGKAPSNQAPAPLTSGPSQAQGSLAPVLLRGPAAIGHPWPGAAKPASMPVCPLRRTCARPADAADHNQNQKRGGLTADLISGIRIPMWERACSRRGRRRMR